jgi:hypothetical protein
MPEAPFKAIDPTHEIPPSLTFDEWVQTNAARDAYAAWLKRTQLNAAKERYNKAIDVAKEQLNKDNDSAEMTFVRLTMMDERSKK